MFVSIYNLFVKCFAIDKWNIGVVDQSIEELVANKKLSSVNWLKEDNVDYAADPFIVKDKNNIKIYYEELNFWQGKGKIMMMENFDFKTKKNISGITPSQIHLSYPYLLQNDEDLFCIPETSESLEIGLYKVDKNNPTKLKKQKVLVEGKQFVDSSIIFYSGKYWLFTSVSGINNQLFIYYSNHIDGDYLPHELNPILVENKACRGAGNLFCVGGIMYRPTQNSSTCYGGSIQMNKVISLTESQYQTETVFEILPDETYKRGIHQISFTKDKIVVDGKRRVFNITTPFKKLARKVSV
ncbi:hypothetical protein D3C87_706650 [compost metagenome]